MRHFKESEKGRLTFKYTFMYILIFKNRLFKNERIFIISITNEKKDCPTLQNKYSILNKKTKT